MTRHRVSCVTCGCTNYAEGATPPTGWGLECKRCREGTPGKARKSVRHCSICREPIITHGISGSVRLICNVCAEKDRSLIDVEKSVRMQSKLREELAQAHEQINKMDNVQVQMKADFQQALEARTQEALTENKQLKWELQQKEENSLADRIKAKIRLKYGESDRKRLIEFLTWLKETHAKLWVAGEKTFQADTADAPPDADFEEWLLEAEVRGLVDEYLRES
jgi:hypothetical protein